MVVLHKPKNLLPHDALFGLTSGRSGPIRAADFERWAQTDGDPLELIEGWPLPMSPGTFSAGEVLVQLAAALSPLVGEHGWRMSLDARHRLPAPPETVVFPNLAIHASDAVDLATGTETVARVPNLVVEILSPDTCERDRAPRGAKFLAYEMSGVSEYYYVWPDGREAAGFHLRDGRYAPAPRDAEGFFTSPLLNAGLRLVAAAVRRG